MKPVLWIPASCALALALSSCGNSGSSGSQQAGTGPFDRNGRYIDEWADNPSKWRKASSSPSPHEMKSDDLPQIASAEQPPANANPLASASSSKPVPVISRTQVPSKSTATSPSRTVASSSKPSGVKSKPREETVVKTKPKPKTVVKAKPKPKSTRYVVKSGDSLSAIASRTGASVSAIRSANGISGSMIRPGQSLTIPKR